jgi:two-component system sensor histidine kinase/response regulator
MLCYPSKAVRLDALCAVVGDNREKHLKFLNKFVVSAQSEVRLIELAAASRDCAEIGRLGHKLKSPSRAMGAESFAAACQTLETAGKNMEWPVIDAIIPQLGELLNEVKQFVLEYSNSEGNRQT